MNEKIRRIDLDDYIQVGEGGNGKTYEHPGNPDILLKVNNAPRNDVTTVRQELEVAQHVLALGLSTPRIYDMVRVGEGFGLLFERIKGKRSLSRICADDPSRIVEAAAMLATLGKQLHATPCDTSFFPSRKELALTGVKAFDFVDDADRAVLQAFVQTLADETTCTHGDFQTGNLIVSGEDKPYWIDLGAFSHGKPMFDIGHLFLICQVYSQFPQTQDIFHMSQAQMQSFWDAFATAYTESDDHAAFDAQAGKFAPLDICIRTVLMPTPDALKAFFGKIVHGLVERFFNE